MLACAPPLIIFIIGTGKERSVSSPKVLYNGIFKAFALACAKANDTAKIAFAPKFFLFSVPSRLINNSSNVDCSNDWFIMVFFISVFIL